MVLYKLNTVTYGTTCAPYLATRTIQQLARDEGEHYPLAASVTIRDIYMDDILTAAYGAVLYAQSISEEDVSTRLLCSKSRVAPVKPITIPRLELCVIVTAPEKRFYIP
ncbi:uncharacterized protein TNCV_2147991 [Trichonephila clavipes]|uniref:Uncharacterized protein n=1 Tax=Trichonephila clavipes TaxID=2585209 RepID=A0A8X6T4N0_TRICX|nr:uncharacterized protein TNCV_2147991 [Trichonephila clavipes]